MTGPLEGVRVLVVEDRVAIAMLLCDAIEETGGVVTGPAGRLSKAMTLAKEAEVDVGLFDVDLDGEASFPAAMALRERGVPVILLTGYDPKTVPAELADAMLLQKPVELTALVQALSQTANRKAHRPAS